MKARQLCSSFNCHSCKFKTLGHFYHLTLLIFGIFVQMLINPITGKGQAKDNVEISFFSINSMQGNYTSQFGNVSYTNNLKLYGTNRGFKIDYKRRLFGRSYFKVGMGYMEFAVDKIENELGSGYASATGDSRSINYPSAVFILYGTTKYHYNTLLYHLGFERQFGISRNLSFFIGLDYFYAGSLSQEYYIPKIQTYYHTENQGGFGNIFNLNLGVSKKLGNFSLLPALVIPVYKSWKQDIVFYENPKNTVSNWGNGVGISLSISYY